MARKRLDNQNVTLLYQDNLLCSQSEGAKRKKQKELYED